MLERFLAKRDDVKLISALQGSIGIDLARQHRPDLILLDMNLPDMGGEQVLRTLKADPATAKFPVVAVSGEMLRDREKELKTLGVLEMLMKPYKLADITAVLERNLPGK